MKKYTHILSRMVFKNISAALLFGIISIQGEEVSIMV